MTSEEFYNHFYHFENALVETFQGGVFHAINFNEKKEKFMPIVKKYFPNADGLNNSNPYTIRAWVKNNETLIKETLK